MRPNLRRPAPELGPRARRSIDRILAATKDVFLAKGYAGTAVDEIAQVAGVSRASFYTYFPSKRDALLALGAKASDDLLVLLDRLDGFGRGWTGDDLEGWATGYFAYLDAHGAFSLAWTQAATEDAALRKAGMKHHLWLCTRFGEVLGELRGKPFASPAELGLALFSMLERSWSFATLYAGTVEREALAREAAAVIGARMAGA